MRKSQEVIGLSIYHLQTGKKLGTVSDLLFDTEEKLQGLLLESGGFFKRGKYIPVESVSSIGKDAVIVEDGATVLPLDSLKNDWFGVATGKKHLKGRPVLLSTGNEIGSIAGVYFMEEMGTLIGYELSEGLISDLRKGRRLLKAKHPLLWGDQVCIARTDDVELNDI